MKNVSYYVVRGKINDTDEPVIIDITPHYHQAMDVIDGHNWYVYHEYMVSSYGVVKEIWEVKDDYNTEVYEYYPNESDGRLIQELYVCGSDYTKKHKEDLK